MKDLRLQNIFIQKIHEPTFKTIQLNVLRLDVIHPVISGNKWFKLKYYLQQAIDNNHATVATFGGAFSNHILATAYACNSRHLNCVGFIRGEEPAKYSQTLTNAKALNMQLKFISREAYKDKQATVYQNKNLFFIPEGGYGKTGAKGAAEILQLVPNISNYNYIVHAVGTGTMLAGITNASMPHQQCIGISVMKNNFSLEDEMLALVNNDAKNKVKLLHDYSFGGYAKQTQALIDFMNEIYNRHRLPTDFVYTAKALYACYDLINKNYFPASSNILLVHSGGLQGNSSIKNKLLF